MSSKGDDERCNEDVRFNFVNGLFGLYAGLGGPKAMRRTLLDLMLRIKYCSYA